MGYPHRPQRAGPSEKEADVPTIGFPELMVILMILLVVFGASRLPAIGESVGRTVGKLKRGAQGPDQGQARAADKPTGGGAGPGAGAGAGAAGGEPEDAEIVDS